jgi:hypothetical protein
MLPHSLAGGLMVVLLLCGYLGLPVACWWILSRARVSGGVVGLLLAVLSLAVIFLVTGWVYLPARIDLIMAYAPAASGVIGLGLLLQRQRLGAHAVPAGRPRVRVAAHTLLWTYLAAVLLCCAPGVRELLSWQPPVPGDRELLPLPAGLTVLNEQDEVCGSGICGRTITIGTSTGLTANQIRQRLREHLSDAHGWQLGPHDSECRRQGWLIDRTTLCVSIRTDSEDYVIVELLGLGTS